MSKCFFKPLLQVYVLQKLLKVKIIKPQFFTTLDLLLSALNIHNLKMAFNLALNFSGWCILIFFKSKASGTIYKHDMSHLLFEGADWSRGGSSLYSTRLAQLVTQTESGPGSTRPTRGSKMPRLEWLGTSLI